jgi:hypothetical protein
MNPTREELLFGVALTRPAAERAAFFYRECGDDQALRAHLEALLFAHEQQSGFLPDDQWARQFGRHANGERRLRAGSWRGTSVKLAGPAPGTQYDVLNVTGIVSLAGQLTLNYINGYSLRQGQEFDVLKFGGNVLGAFDRIVITGLETNFQYQVKQIGAGTISLVAASDGIATSPPLLSIARVGRS